MLIQELKIVSSTQTNIFLTSIFSMNIDHAIGNLAAHCAITIFGRAGGTGDDPVSG
jgi:hypothetical protein